MSKGVSKKCEKTNDIHFNINYIYLYNFFFSLPKNGILSTLPISIRRIRAISIATTRRRVINILHFFFSFYSNISRFARIFSSPTDDNRALTAKR